LAADPDQGLELAHQHTARLGCRSLDVLQVAAAVLAGIERFVTADRRQSQLARRAGLPTTRLS
jgi:predicted nucleic acid-binding protein